MMIQIDRETDRQILAKRLIGLPRIREG